MVTGKSAVSAAVPSVEGLRIAQTGFRGTAGEGSGGKERTGFHRRRNASAKPEIPVDESALDVQLTPEDLSDLEAEFSKLKVHGGRMNEMQMQIVERAG